MDEIKEMEFLVKMNIYKEKIEKQKQQEEQKKNENNMDNDTPKYNLYNDDSDDSEEEFIWLNNYYNEKRERINMTMIAHKQL